MRTQENFSRQCPIVSQARSLVEVSMGDAEAARRTQIEQGKMLNGLVDSVPVVGHIKGGVHYACGDRNGGDAAMKASSRTTGVLGGGAVGFIAGGPVGAVAGGIAGGGILDGATTAVDSGIHGEFRPSGYVAAVNECVNEGGCKKAGAIFDAALMPVGDGLAGYAAGQAVKGMTKQSAAQTSRKSSVRGTATPSAAAIAENNLQAQMQRSSIVRDAVGRARQFRRVPGKTTVPLYEVPRAGARLFGHETVTDFPIVNKEAIAQIKADIPQGKPIHVLTGAHGAEFQAQGRCSTVPSSYAESSFFRDYQKSPIQNVIAYDGANPIHLTKFKAALAGSQNVCYIDWCFGLDNKLAQKS